MPVIVKQVRKRTTPEIGEIKFRNFVIGSLKSEIHYNNYL